VYDVPVPGKDILESMRAPPDRDDDFENVASSDDESGRQSAPGAYPGTKDDYAGTGSYY
jgi:hypothetical protein